MIVISPESVEQVGCIVLRPNSDDPRFQPIHLDPADAQDLRIVAELVQVL